MVLGESGEHFYLYLLELGRGEALSRPHFVLVLYFLHDEGNLCKVLWHLHISSFPLLP